MAAQSAGFEVDTVADEGLAGAVDVDVVRAARRAGRFLVTLDRGLADIRLHPPGSHAGILVLRVADQQPATVVDALVDALMGLDLDDLATCIVVVQANQVRVRRP